MTPRWVVAIAAGLVAVLLVIAVATRQAGIAVLTGLQDCGTAAVVDDLLGGQQTGGAVLKVRAATWNARYTNTSAGIVAGIRAIGAGADVIGLQELNSATKRRAVAQALSPEWVMTDGAARNAVPIVWRRSVFDLVGSGSELASDVSRVEHGADGLVSNERYISWVRLRQKSTGSVFAATNTHLLPTIDRAGHPDRSKPARLRVYDQEVSRLLQLVDRLTSGGPVIVTMDGNIDARADGRVRDPRWPQVRMGRYGLSSNWRLLGYPSGGTHERRLIDYVWATTNTIRPVDQRILGKYGSDHSAVAVTLTNRPTTANTAPTAGLQNGTGTTTRTLPGKVSVPGARPGTTLTLTGEQVANAAVVIFEGKANHIPPDGWVVALTAALQESGIRNLRYGDRDSQGMFQQRPSAGWGTPAQIRDPHLAAQAFYGVAAHTQNRGLVDIPRWQHLSIAEAAQAVQMSAFPGAYAKWEPAARAIVQQLDGSVTESGNAPGGVADACADQKPAEGQIGSCPATGLSAERGLTPDALLVLRCAKVRFPTVSTFYGVGERPANTDDDHQTGRAVDLMIPDHRSSQGAALGWQIARWMRDHHAELGVHYVIYAAKIWNIDRDAEGWRDYASITGSNDDTSLHYDHVHVSVFGNRGTGPPTEHQQLAGGQWTMPLPKGSYRVGCSFGCYAGHTGQDFPVPAGTAVYSSNSGTVIRSEALQRGGHYYSYGNLIVIRDAANPAVEVYYAHLSQRDVHVGQTVSAGQTIGRAGYTGHVIPAGPRGAHLHYEIRINGNPTNPIPILSDHGVHP